MNDSTPAASVNDAVRKVLDVWDRVEDTDQVAALNEVSAAMENLRDAIDNPAQTGYMTG
jgi:TPP-dependent trihydroxycyclohexane-1,2-dione (THcHDO) dehydratase